MVVVGADSHKRTHTVVAVDDVGRRLGEKMVAATSEGHLLLVQWAAQWPEVTFALEDCRHLTRRLERDLLCAGHRVVRVPNPADGRAPAVVDDNPVSPIRSMPEPSRWPRCGIPIYRWRRWDGPTREVKLIVDHRRDLVAERTRVHNRLRWHLHDSTRHYRFQPRSAPLLRAHRARTGQPRKRR